MGELGSSQMPNAPNGQGGDGPHCHPARDGVVGERKDATTVTAREKELGSSRHSEFHSYHRSSARHVIHVEGVPEGARGFPGCSYHYLAHLTTEVSAMWEGRAHSDTTDGEGTGEGGDMAPHSPDLSVLTCREGRTHD